MPEREGAAGAGAADEPDVVVIDGAGLRCARLLILLRNRVVTTAPGTVVHLVTSDPVAPIDLPAWCHLTGHDYLGPVPAVRGVPTYGVGVAERAAQTRPDRPWAVVDPG